MQVSQMIGVLNYSAVPLDFEGAVYINKPRHFSSHDVVEIVRRYLGIRRVGHTGTLDPEAEGLLVLLLGRSTSQAEQFLNLEKEYEAWFLLGVATRSGDSDSEIEAVSRNFYLSKKELKQKLKKFEGKLWQKPPLFSALHWRGQRGYELARQGASFEIPARPVEVKFFKLKKLKKWRDFYFARCLIRCGKGVYIRSLAHQLGEELGCGGFLKRLIRTRVGTITLARALSLETFILLSQKKQWAKIIKPIS
jgi:tRNA pseudouridine55 synthase